MFNRRIFAIVIFFAMMNGQYWSVGCVSTRSFHRASTDCRTLAAESELADPEPVRDGGQK